MRFLAKAQDVFQIADRGVVLVLPEDWMADLRFRTGDRIQLRTPDGPPLDTRIAAVELLKIDCGCLVGIMLHREISRKDVPVQPEIWVTAEQSDLE